MLREWFNVNSDQGGNQLSGNKYRVQHASVQNPGHCAGLWHPDDLTTSIGVKHSSRVSPRCWHTADNVLLAPTCRAMGATMRNNVILKKEK